MLFQNRRPIDNGVAYGVVAIVWRESLYSMRKIAIHNGEDYEIMACVGSIPGHSRKMVVVAAYIPPGHSMAGPGEKQKLTICVMLLPRLSIATEIRT